MDHTGGILEVESFTEQVGGNEDVGLKRGHRRRRPPRHRSECPQHFLSRDALDTEQPRRAGDRRHAYPSRQLPQQIAGGRASFDEHDRPGAVENLRERFELGVDAHGEQRAQARDCVGFDLLSDRPGFEQHRKQRQLQLRRIPSREEPLKIARRQASVLRGGVAREITIGCQPFEALQEGGRAGGESPQQGESHQRRDLTPQLDAADAGHQLREVRERDGRRTNHLSRRTRRERERRPIPTIHSHARAGYREARGDSDQRVVRHLAQRRQPQRRHAEPGEGMVPEKQPEEVKQVGDPVVNRRRRDEQRSSTDDETRQVVVALGRGITKPMRLVDEPEPDARTVGRAD